MLLCSAWRLRRLQRTPTRARRGCDTCSTPLCAAAAIELWIEMAAFLEQHTSAHLRLLPLSRSIPHFCQHTTRRASAAHSPDTVGWVARNTLRCLPAKRCQPHSRLALTPPHPLSPPSVAISSHGDADGDRRSIHAGPAVRRRRWRRSACHVLVMSGVRGASHHRQPVVPAFNHQALCR